MGFVWFCWFQVEVANTSLLAPTNADTAWCVERGTAAIALAPAVTSVSVVYAVVVTLFASWHQRLWVCSCAGDSIVCSSTVSPQLVATFSQCCGLAHYQLVDL
jgi:hypothetical protein